MVERIRSQGFREHRQDLERLFTQARTILGLDVSLVLWETTSTYFEGAGPEGLAAFDPSKDARLDRTEVVIGALMSVIAGGKLTQVRRNGIDPPPANSFPT